MTIAAYNLKRIRLFKGLSQPELAEILHVNRNTLQSWEDGRTKNIPTAVINKMAAMINKKGADIISEQLSDVHYPPKKPDMPQMMQEANSNQFSTVSQNMNSGPMTLQTCMQALGFAEKTISTLELLIREKDERISMLRKN